jgi:hypothetical protein
MKRERLVNRGVTTLSATATSSDTTISVTDGSVFPAEGNFRLLADNEQMICTARAGNTLTVVRGDEGTTPAGHVSGITIVADLTAGNLHQFLADNVAGADGSRPPLGLFDSSGDRLTSPDFTTVNLSDSTVTDADGAILLRMAASGLSGKSTILTRSAPATPNSLIVGLQPTILVSSTGVLPVALMGFRESSTGKFMTIGLQNQGSVVGVVCQRFDSTSSLNSTPFAKQCLASVGPVVWFKATDDGTTNLKFFVGNNGTDWIQVYSESRTAFMASGPNELCWGCLVGGDGVDILNRLVCYLEA